jgi:electron transfer flavoprotein alpha/beta subunit
MKILVPIKRVIDYAVKIRILPSKKGVETSKSLAVIFFSIIENKIVG